MRNKSTCRSTGVSIANLLSKRPTGENIYRRAGDKIFCTTCNTTLVARKYILDRHINTALHVQNGRRRMKQTQLKDNPSEAISDIGLALVEAFLSANIPLNKLNNPLLKSFLNTYLPCKVVSITTMRSKYIDRLYDTLLQAVQERIRGK